MIKLEHVVMASPEQMEFIIEGMRNPMNSWEKSDSKVCNYIYKGYCDACEKQDNCATYREETDFYLGGMDEELMQRLAKAGTDHRKFMRMMPVYVRITAPLYWWKEFDTYKVGTVANSCSTMHKIQEKEFTIEDFSIEHLNDDRSAELSNVEWLEHLIHHLNRDRLRFIETKNKQYWWQMIQLLPSSYNQTRNVSVIHMPITQLLTRLIENYLIRKGKTVVEEIHGKQILHEQWKYSVITTFYITGIPIKK